jgi:alginate O-acetyltransferase complex protein AlgI
MLFNSYTFLLAFLPLVVAGFLLLRRTSYRGATCWLVTASLVYYGWWNPADLWVIGGSCVANFFLGRHLAGHRGGRAGKAVLFLGVAANLGLLCWYKYAGLFAKTLAALGGDGPAGFIGLALPLGLSFFTFQQIAYLVDAWRGETEEYHFTDYLLFVTFFPQLVAGPIVHHREMMPQFRQRWTGWHRHLPVALGFLAIGMFKKVVIADNAALVANPLFHFAAHGDRALTIVEAWTAALSYGVQIYFDFSGYSDMAIGAARLFGIRLPVNFHSPYKAASVIDFWRRWHITLSRFLRDYLSIPLGGGRCGKVRRYGNLMLTMLLGGLWHGAGWTFLLWGGLHGLYLCLNHGWHWLRKNAAVPAIPRPLAVALTFVAVMAAWVPFRAGNLELEPGGTATAALGATKSILASMFGFEGLTGWPEKANRIVATADPLRLLPALLACWLLPNTQEIFRRYRPVRWVSPRETLPRYPNRRWQWRPTPRFALALVVLAVVIGLQFDKVSEFIYFQF